MDARFNLSDCTILLAFGGSRAYGTDTPESDVDLRGVAIPPAQFYHGCVHKFEQTAENVLGPALGFPGADSTIFELRRFMHLAMQMQSTAVDLLFCREEEVLLTSKIGRRLRESRHLFVSMAAAHSYGGHARGRLGALQLRRQGDSPLVSLKTAAGVYRLLTMRREILETGEVHVWRGDRDADKLRAVRAGEVPLTSLIEWAEAELAQQDVNKPVVPAKPDVEAIDTLCMELIELALSEGVRP